MTQQTDETTPPSKSEALRECPNPWCDGNAWAGGDAIIRVSEIEDDGQVCGERRMCAACGLRGPVGCDEAEALALWNRRALTTHPGNALAGEIKAHVERYDTPKEDDPRRRYTSAQLETAIRLALRRPSASDGANGVEESSKKAAADFLASWPRHSFASYIEPALAEAFERFARTRDAGADAMRSENERLREALTPSAATKAAYIGEFAFAVEAPDQDDDEGYGVRTENITVPWTTIKEIMGAIRARAALKSPAHASEQTGDLDSGGREG